MDGTLLIVEISNTPEVCICRCL